MLLFYPGAAPSVVRITACFTERHSFCHENFCLFYTDFPQFATFFSGQFFLIFFSGQFFLRIIPVQPHLKSKVFCAWFSAQKHECSGRQSVPVQF